VNGIDALLDHPAVRALGWALVHFVWQGAIVAALLAGLLAALRKRSAEIRYAAACVALLAMVALPAVTVGVVASHGRRFNDARVRASAAVHFVPAAPARALTPAGEARVATDAPLAQQVVSAPPVRPPAPWAQWAAALCEPWLPWCVVGWAVGVVLLSAPLIGGWRRLQRLTRQGTQPTSEDWQARFVRVAQRLRVSRPVRVLASALTQVPIVIGWLRPVILLPASALTGLTPEQLEAILAHELAHVRRHDYLVNLLQSVIETLLFYHPAVWWVSRRIRVERELCCDDWAVRACGDAFTYARALASLEEQRAIELAPAATGGSLLARVRHILVDARPGQRRAGSAAVPADPGRRRADLDGHGPGDGPGRSAGGRRTGFCGRAR
jgi:beta-lactamase regulating signal transducer with metallopeptidase domain